MLEILAVVGLTAASFVSTSLDNFILLLGFYADERYARGRVLLGYTASTVGMVLLAHGAAAAAETAPSHLLGTLGLIPMGLGVWGLFRLVRPASLEAAGEEAPPRGFLAVLGVMLANSGDSLAVLVSVFADTAESLEIWVIATAVAMTLGYGIVARWFAGIPGVAARMRRYSRVVLPFLLIAIGAYILANSPTDAVP